jgi:hypothetical protein
LGGLAAALAYAVLWVAGLALGADAGPGGPRSPARALAVALWFGLVVSSAALLAARRADAGPVGALPDRASSPSA